jgi:hypothetical protein
MSANIIISYFFGRSERFTAAIILSPLTMHNNY